ncbi:MAG: Eco57I restriction-modification methylase domain-containing protein [Gemmatimonas sp.]
MKGFVPTPAAVVDLMVSKLFAEHAPHAESRVLDPGCGNGEFIGGVLRICSAKGWPVPQIVGVELDPERAATACRVFRGIPQVTICNRDFLLPSHGQFDFIIGNPPYVSILDLSPEERRTYRGRFQTARGRFDLYVLFFEQALRMVAPSGRIVFITPEKYLYVETARPLRELFRATCVEELYFAGENTFPDRVTYPLITTIVNSHRGAQTRVVHRDSSVSHVSIASATTWQPIIAGYGRGPSSLTLADVASRISCGVATGADAVYVVPTDEMPSDVREFAYPTISGRQIMPTREFTLQSSLLAPYDSAGELLPESSLGALGQFLRQPDRRRRLESRTCVARKPWYAFHDNFPLKQILRPKLLCKDITAHPFFLKDEEGTLVPRHSVYYIVPAVANDLEPLSAYLNSREAADWLRANCQRAAGGFLRLQSHVLKQLPLPASFAVSAAAVQMPDLSLELALA